MKNHRISTTISQKHWELLKKQSEKFETQQKTIEFALESLENSSKQSPALTLEEKYWMRLKRAKSLVIFEKSAFKSLIENADIENLNELFIRNKTVEYTIELYFQKPLKECSLNEVIDGVVINLKITNQVDTIDYADNGGYYKLIITHASQPADLQILLHLNPIAVFSAGLWANLFSKEFCHNRCIG